MSEGAIIYWQLGGDTKSEVQINETLPIEDLSGDSIHNLRGVFIFYQSRRPKTPTPSHKFWSVPYMGYR